jgi:hypothetical protein
MASLRAWATAGPYPGRLLSPRSEKTTLTRDRLGDVVETRAVSDVAGDSVETTVIGRGGLLRGSYLDDPRLLRSSYLDDPLYRRSVFPLRAYDRAYLSPRHESVTKTTNGVDTIETVTADNAVTGEHEVTQKVHNNVTGEDEVVHAVRSPRGDRVTTRSLSPRGHSRILFDDLLDPRRRGLREDFLLDDMRTKRYNDRLTAGLNSRSLYLDDPQWRRPKTRVDDPLLARHYLEDPLRRYAVSDYSLYDPLYRHSALDYPLAGRYSALDYPLAGNYRLADPRLADPRLADPFYNDYLARRTAYAVDDPLYRRSAYLDAPGRNLMTDPLYRALR